MHNCSHATADPSWYQLCDPENTHDLPELLFPTSGGGCQLHFLKNHPEDQTASFIKNEHLLNTSFS